MSYHELAKLNSGSKSVFIFDDPIPKRCLGRLCCVSSGCDLSKTCEENACGAFRITKQYWMDSGNWTYNDHHPDQHQSFVKCVTNFFCSHVTLQEYMKKFKRDCNGDGKIDCEDYVAVHILGKDNCHQALPKKYKERYDWCQTNYIW